jgi:hypothetical protein
MGVTSQLLQQHSAKGNDFLFRLVMKDSSTISTQKQNGRAENGIT